MSDSIKILLVEDNPGDARLIQIALSEAGSSTRFDLTSMDTLSKAFESLKADGPDAILLDLNLPDSHGIGTVTSLAEKAGGVPIIVLTGLDDEALAMYALQNGAQDYLVKNQLDGNLLRRSIRYAIERKRAEEALQVSEERFRALIKNGRDNISLLAADGTLIWESPSVFSTLGYPSEEFMGHNIFELMHPDDFPWAKEEFERVVRAPGENSEGTFRLRRSDGSWIWIEATAINLLAEPAVKAIVINYHDITGRKRTEEAFADIQKRFQALIENAPDGIALLGQDGKLQQITPSTKQILGYSLEEAQGQEPALLTHPDDLPALLGLLNDLIQNPGKVVRTEYRFRHKDGSWRWLESTISNMLAEPGLNAIVFNYRDITERKQAEEALKKSENEYRRLFDTANEVIVIFEPEQEIILEANESACATYGYDRDELIGLSLHKLTKDVARGSAQVQSLLEAGTFRDFESIHFNKKGQQIHFLINSSVIEYRGGKAVLSINRDITERKRAEEKIRRHLTELEILYENGLAVSRLNDPREIGKQIIENLANHLSWHHVTLRLRRGESDDLEVIAFNQPGVQESERDALEDHLNAMIQNVSQGLSGWVMQTGEAFRTGNVRSHPQYVDTHSNIRSGLYVPLRIAERVIGIISVESESADAFSAQDERLLSTLANQAAIALENARLFHAVQKELEQRKQADEALRISETRFRALIERTADLIIVIDAEGIIQFVSPSGERILGYSSAESLGRNFLEYIHPEDMEIALESLASRREVPGIAPAAIELRSLHKNGTWRSMDVLGTNLLDEPAVRGIVLNVRDVTERKLAEVGLRQAEEKYRNIFDNAMEAITLTTPDGKFIDANPATARMLGYDSPEELIAGVNDLARQFYVQSGRRAEIKRMLEELGSVSEVESEVYRRDGSKLWISENSTAVRAEDGSLLRYEGSAIDITERKRAEQQINLQLQRLRALNDIDRAISSSIDMRVSLDILLGEVRSQLDVDAASVLLLNTANLMLEYVAGKGFRTPAIRQSRSHLGEGLAGQAGLERRVIHVANLLEAQEKFKRAELLKGEDFKEYFGVPLIAKGQLIGVLEIFSRTFLTSDAEWVNYMETLGGQAAIAIDNAKMFAGMQQSHMELAVAYDATIEGWSRALDLRDKETEGHTQRVTELTVRLAERMGLTPEQIVHIRRGALLHDIGKLGVPDHILLKPGTLTEEEWEFMRQHPTHALNMLMPIKYLGPALDIPYCHHEKWDGTGYPRGLKGEQIPLAARLFALVDVWDALLSDRPYRAGWTVERSRKYILEQSGKHFDPAIVEIFQDLTKEE